MTDADALSEQPAVLDHVRYGAFLPAVPVRRRVDRFNHHEQYSKFYKAFTACVLMRNCITCSLDLI